MNGELDFEKPISEIEKRIQGLRDFAKEKRIDFTKEISELERKSRDLKKEVFSNLTAWQRTQLARHLKRPTTLDYIGMLFENFIELHGDRVFGDDKALIYGLAKLDGEGVVVMGHQKGRDTKENIARNFGMAHPEGYRKALRLMKFAEKFRKPIVCLIDTPGAHPGLEAEERGQFEAIARNLREMSQIAVPIVVVIIGEGGSGGALGIGIGDRILMMENSVYFVCTPETCSIILWKNPGKADVAAEASWITAPALLRLGVIDEIIPEPSGGAHRDPGLAAQELKKAILSNLSQIRNIPQDDLVQMRYEKFRKMGAFTEEL
jgi:acetyl-CoA carboxylase carboxyl transferase subunit alpha